MPATDFRRSEAHPPSIMTRLTKTSSGSLRALFSPLLPFPFGRLSLLFFRRLLASSCRPAAGPGLGGHYRDCQVVAAGNVPGGAEAAQSGHHQRWKQIAHIAPLTSTRPPTDIVCDERCAR
jgi:hypothetical protein